MGLTAIETSRIKHVEIALWSVRPLSATPRQGIQGGPG